MAQQIQLRRGTASAWTTANPILALGEFGYETDTHTFKIGDGTTSWSALSYFAGGGSSTYAGLSDAATVNLPTVNTPLGSALNLKAPLASPALTGTPTAPTAAAATNTTQVATTAHVFAERANTATLTNKTLTAPVINSPTGIVKADVGLGSVDNTSDASKNSAAVTLTNKTISGATNTLTNLPAANITGVIPIANLATGTPSGSKFIRDDGTLQSIPGGGDALTSNPLSQFAATTSAQLASIMTNETGTGVLVFSDSPALTGTPTAPTASGGTNTTQIATTAFVTTGLATRAPLTPVVENIATGSAYTLVTADNGKVKRGIDTSAQTINITTAFNGLGCTIEWPAASGVITLDAGTGVNLNGLGDGVNITLANAAGAISILPTGTNTFSVVGSIGDLLSTDITDSTTTGRSVLTAASATAARSAIGVVIGTDVQAQDATLAAFAALTIAANSITLGTGADAFSQLTLGANTFPGRSSSGNVVAKPMTDFGFSLIDDADATAARATLGVAIGTDVQAYNAYLAKIAAAVPRAVTTTVTLGPTDVDCTIRANSGSTFVITLANDATLTPVVGKSAITVFVQGVGVPTFAAGTATLLGSPRSGIAQNEFIVLVHTGIADTWAYA